MRYEKWAAFQLFTCFSTFLDFITILMAKKGEKGFGGNSEICSIFVVLSRKSFSNSLK